MFWRFSAHFPELPLCAKSFGKKISTNHMTQHHFSPQFDKVFPPCHKMHYTTTAHSFFVVMNHIENSIESFFLHPGNSRKFILPAFSIVWKESELFYWSQLCSICPGSMPGWTYLPRKVVSVLTAILHFKVIHAWIGID